MTYQEISLLILIRHPFLTCLLGNQIGNELSGVKNIPIRGADVKRQITAKVDVSATGNFLPTQLIYTEKNKRCLPYVEFPHSFHITYTKNQWSNEDY